MMRHNGDNTRLQLRHLPGKNKITDFLLRFLIAVDHLGRNVLCQRCGRQMQGGWVGTRGGGRARTEGGSRCWYGYSGSRGRKCSMTQGLRGQIKSPGAGANALTALGECVSDREKGTDKLTRRQSQR